MRQGHAVAVITRHTNLSMMRTPSRLELTYLATADALSRMIAAGEFPNSSAPTGRRRGAPRAGDGVVRLDYDGRHHVCQSQRGLGDPPARVAGEVMGGSLAEIVTSVLRDCVPGRRGPAARRDRPPALAHRGRLAGATVTMRAIPLTEAGQRFGALLLLRDVSELRRREQELLTKDATIREIHHRVKNNLQSVAALLRLQARRTDDAQARAALEEAVRRVGHHRARPRHPEQGVRRDRRLRRGRRPGLPRGRRGGRLRQADRARRVTGDSFGRLRAEDATSLAMILSELVQNAIEHGLPGRHGGTVTVDVNAWSASPGPRTC